MTIASKSVRRSYYYYYYKEKERKVNFRTRFFLMLANEFWAFEHSPLFFVDIIIHCSLLRTCRVRVEEKEEFLVYTVLWTLTCHPYLESATALSDTCRTQIIHNNSDIISRSSPTQTADLYTKLHKILPSKLPAS